MKVEQIRMKVENYNRASFKLFALTYIVEKTTKGSFSIYAISLPKLKRYYKSFDELITEYRIFGDNIISYEDRVKILD